MMSNYYTEINNSTLNKDLFMRTFGKGNSGQMNFTLAGVKKKSINDLSSMEDKNSKSLMKLKNLTIAKYKIVEAAKIMPSNLRKSVNDSVRKKEDDKKFEEMKHYNTNVNLEEIDFDNMKFVPKKKKTKKVNLTSKLNEIYSFDSPSKKQEKVKEEKMQKDPFQNEMKEELKEFYKSYCEEMERHFHQSTQKNENLLLKLNSYKMLEEDYQDLQREMQNFILFKKIMRKNRNIEVLEEDGKSVNKTPYFSNFYCENPKCVSTALKYVESKREYDMLLIQNNNLKKYYSDLKNRKIKLKNTEAQFEEFY